MIYYLSLAYVMAALLCFSYFISTSMFNGGRTSLPLTSTQPPCYITMIAPKHTVFWHQLVPYIDTHNISWWIHDPTDTMGWFPSPFSTYLASDSMANAVFDHNYGNNKQILLLSKGKIYHLVCNRTYAHRIPDIFYPHADIECQMPCWRVVNMRCQDRLHTYQE